MKLQILNMSNGNMSIFQKLPYIGKMFLCLYEVVLHSIWKRYTVSQNCNANFSFYLVFFCFYRHTYKLYIPSLMYYNLQETPHILYGRAQV